MRMLKFCDGDKICWGIVEGETVFELEGTPYNGIVKNGRTLDYANIRLAAPCDPTKIVAVGKNYRDHATELGGDVPKEPILFIKPSTALNSPEGVIVCPGISERVDYEGELAFVIKKAAKDVRREEAADYILGYTCLNDVTARDLQLKDGQWTRAKGFDTFAPMGPVLTDEVDPASLHIETRVNGKAVQNSNTENLMWDVGFLMEFITQCMTLMPGDVVTTGTPAGIGPIIAGDVVEVEIEGIGILKNTVV